MEEENIEVEDEEVLYMILVAYCSLAWLPVQEIPMKAIKPVTETTKRGRKRCMKSEKPGKRKGSGSLPLPM